MKVELTEDEWARLLNAAALAPYAQIAPIITKVVQQIQAAADLQTQPVKQES